MVARSATTHRAGLRGDAPASIESVSTAAQSKGQVSSSSSKMRSQQGLKKSSASSSRKKEHANRIPPNHTTTASKSTKKSHKSMAAASKGTTAKTRPKSMAAKSKATVRTGTTGSNPSKTRPAKQKRVEEETIHFKEKTSAKVSSRKPYRPISHDREDIESTESSEKEHRNAASSRKPSSSIPSKNTAASSSKVIDRSVAPTKKSRGSTKKSSSTSNKIRSSEVRSSKPAPTIKSVKSTKSAFSRLSKSTKTKMSKKVPSSLSAKTPGSKSRSSMREHKSEQNDHYEEEKEEEDEGEEVNDEEIEEDGEDIHEATADARTEAESELKVAKEGEPKSRGQSSRHSSRQVPKSAKHSRSHATSSRHYTTSKNASKSKRSGPSRRSSSHQETYTYDDSTVSTYQTRPLPVITFSNVQCNQMMADTYEEMGKYAVKPLGLAVVRCACGSHGDNGHISHQRSYSEPIYKQGQPPASSTVGLNSIHHHPDCPSYHQQDSHADAPSSPTSGDSPRPSATPRSTEGFTEYGPTQYAPTEYAIDDGKTAAISALTMPPLPPNKAAGNVDGSAFNLTVHDQDGERPIPSTDGEACKQANLDQIALQGIFDQYDEFVANSKVAANNIVSEMQDMSLEKVKQKAESLGNTMTTLFQRAPKTTSRPNLAANKWKDDAVYIHRNQVTIMTPSEEAQDDWESGHVQLRLTESQQHLTESCEPRNPYARLDAVEVIDDSPLKSSLPPVPEEALVDDEEVADESAYFQME